MRRQNLERYLALTAPLPDLTSQSKRNLERCRREAACKSSSSDVRLLLSVTRAARVCLLQRQGRAKAAASGHRSVSSRQRNG